MSDVPTGGRPVFTGPIVPLVVRVPEELATYLELLANINGRSKTDEYRVALENHAINAKSDPRVQTRVQQVIERIDAEAKAKRDVLSSMLASKPTTKTATPKATPAADKSPASPAKAGSFGLTSPVSYRTTMGHRASFIFARCDCGLLYAQRMESTGLTRIMFHFAKGNMDGRLEFGADPDDLRLTHSLTIDVGEDTPLFSFFLQAVREDETIPDEVRNSILDGYFYFELLPEGVTSAAFTPGVDETEPINWTFDPVLGLVIPFDVLHRDSAQLVTPRELRELIEEGYAKGNPTELVVVVPNGLGGGGPVSDFVEWLLDVGVDIGIDVAIITPVHLLLAKLTSRVRGGIRDRRARRLAALWESRNLREPEQLRRFFEVKDTWTVAEVMRRTRLAKASSKQLLRALGYEPDAADTWRIGMSRKAKRRRAKWVRLEGRFAEGFSDL